MVIYLARAASDARVCCTEAAAGIISAPGWWLGDIRRADGMPNHLL